MKKCVGFGHKDYPYRELEGNIEKILVHLIEKEKVTQFYFGGRGNFDNTCSFIVGKLKERYPHITNTLFLSYLPTEKSHLTVPKQYDDTEYVLEKFVPPKYAILETNKAVIDKCDIILSGIAWHFGGAYKAIEYAQRKEKNIISLLPEDDC